MSKPIQAYHFTNGWKLRDGQKLVEGKEYVFAGEPVMCKCGYHASKHVMGALKYAPGSTLSLVECSEVTDREIEKFVCKRRKVIKVIDVDDILREFARWCALQVIDLWNAPDVVVQYLKTGDDSIRAAAQSAAWSAAESTSRAAAWSAVDAAAESAAGSAMWSAVERKQRAKFARMINKRFSDE